MEDKILEVNNLSVSFIQYGKGLQETCVEPVKDLSIDIRKGEVLTIIGASGSGKSLLAHAIMGILPGNAVLKGEMRYKAKKLDKNLIKKLRGKEIVFIPQSVNYLDPLMKVKDQVQIGLDKLGAKERQEELFKRYGLNKEDGELYPFQLSGGMLRRVLFATSVRDDVELIIADEPTPGIHPEALEIILKQLREFADKGMAVMLITHDIFSAVKIADRVSIFKDGRTIETSPASYFKDGAVLLKTEYARKLWRSLPQNEFMELEETL